MVSPAAAPQTSSQGDAPSQVRRLARVLAARISRPWTLMEVCGGQTHAIVRSGLDQLLPQGLRLIHGPGCPVCVTPASTLDQALDLARLPQVILCSYGDMLRVPGSGREDLLSVRAAGADVRLLTTPLQALELARRHPERQVVFLAVGFETTAPATALLARHTLATGIGNLSLLIAHVRVAPAMEAILADPGNAVQGFLAAGHVCAVVGTAGLQLLVDRWQLPVVVSGFEPLELMTALLRCVLLLEAGEPRLLNAYKTVVRPQGNPAAIALLQEVFNICDQPWRGLGTLADGGLTLRGPYAALDARRRFALTADDPLATGQGAGGTEGVCIAGAILRGRALPTDCQAFGRACIPDHPLGAPMVSSEGACAAYFRYRRG